MYLLFLGTFFNLCLFGSLTIIKSNEDYLLIDKSELYAFSDEGVGLSAIPLPSDQGSVISYRSGEETEYKKYINTIDTYLNKNNETRHKRSISEFGPCGNAPYGYGEAPCIFVRINRQRNWSAQPLKSNSTMPTHLPKDVDKWIMSGRSKLWLHCKGINPWDEDHLGLIRYFPHPPGFDPDKFPLGPSELSPAIAVQFTNITLGISLSVHCRVWYVKAVSTLEFVLYISNPKKH